MAFKIGPSSVIGDTRDGAFNFLNVGAYTTSQLMSQTVTGTLVGDFVYDTDRDELTFWDGTIWLIEDISGGNATFTPGDGYKYVFFTSPGTLTVTGSNLNVEYIVIGSGGYGGPAGTSQGSESCGGGGAGEWREGTTTLSGPQPVQIGVSSWSQPTRAGTNSPSDERTTFLGPISAYSGGAGGQRRPGSLAFGASGGSGGGGCGWFLDNGGPGGGTNGTGFVNPGGIGRRGKGGGGGGGASQAGSDAPTNQTAPGVGGQGRGATQWTIPTSYGTDGPTPGVRYFAGGGNGGAPGNGSPALPAGGGGRGGRPQSKNGEAGTANTGSGGGGAGIQNNSGGSGGSGIVIVRRLE